MHHAVTSSTAAHVSAIMPILLRNAPRSVRIRASTGNAVTDIEIPMKSTNTGNGTSLVEKMGYKSNDNAAPDKNGTTMLVCEIANTTPLLLRTCAELSSSPTRNM